ncbi:MAG: hypothetical protein LBJ22_00355 [Synergistaceae bacterium]|jgi:hypothetical protein|nr:hypothetical protein [Synergistaceae bacterium]
MRKEFRYVIAISMICVLAAIVVGGAQMPWNEESVRYAVYGSAIGFYASVVLSMFVVWKMQKRK